MKKLLITGLMVLATVFPLTLFSQGGTSLTSPGTAITLPFSASGTTIGAGNNVDDPDPTVTPASSLDNGPDWVYRTCATSTSTVYITVSFTPGGTATPVLPNINIYYDNGGTWLLLATGSVTGDVDQTVGIPFVPSFVGMCYYIVVEGANTSGYNYNINVTTTPLTQTLTTQPGCTNMGFDNGTTSGWTGNWGHSITNGSAGAQTPVYTPIYGTTNMGHHNITTGGLDTYLGVIQQVCPLIPGNTNSMMLGDGPNASFGGAQLMQKFSVTASNALLTYYYAAVMQDAGSDHANYEQPFFKIEALDCSGNPIVCGNYLVTGGPGIPGFIQVGSSSVYYKDWTPVLLDLTPYIGSCVTIKFTIGDCARGAHFAYAYLDATCGPLQITTPPTVCQFSSTTLTAPSGASSYSWVNTASPGTVLSTSNPYTFSPTTTGTQTYQCTMTNVAGCNSTVTTTVTVNPTPQITVTNPAPVCAPNTVDITSGSVVTITSGTGTLSYYSDAACTVPVATPTAITTSGTYYIKITGGNGCYEVKSVSVVVNPTPTVNVSTADQTICAGQSVNLSSTITPAGVNTPLTFTNTTDYSVPNYSVTGASSPITVSGVIPQTAGVLPIVSVQVNIAHPNDYDLTIQLQCPNGSVIELSSQNGGSGDNYTNTVFVPTGISITTGTAPMTGSFTPEQAFSLLNSCSANGTWTLLVYDLVSGNAGGILQDWSITFNSYVPPTFSWSPTTNMTNSTTLTPTVTPTVTTTYTLTGTSGVGGCSATDPVTITVNPIPTATISGTTTVCQNAASPTITFTGANGTAPYTFTYNINGGANQTVSSGAGSTATVSAPTSTVGTFTYNLVSVSSNGCPNSQTGSAVVTVNPLPTATISGTTTVCQNTASPTITFTGANGTAPYTFTYNINGGANQTVSSGAGSIATVSAPTATTGTFTYNLVSVSSANSCSQAQTGSAVVTINPLPTATISGTTTVCQNATAPTITFTGANGTTPYTFTYNINGGANQTVSSGAGSTATVSAPTSTVGTFTYNLVSVSGANSCSQAQTGSAVVTINPLPTATISGTTTVCQNATAPNITFTGANGTAPYTFTYNINGGANQTVSSGAGSTATVSASTATAGTFTYNLVSVSSANSCSQAQTGSAVVTINPLPTATISGTTTVCQNATAPTITFTGANGTAPYTFTYNINGGANQTVSSGAGSTATVSAPTSTVGTFTYNLVSVSGANSCSQTQTGSAVITINPLPTATISGTATVCQNAASPTITFTGANGTAPYTFTYNINGGANQTVSSGAGNTATVSAPTSTVGTFTYNLVSVSIATGCPNTQTGSAVVTINPLPTATISGTTTICQNAASPNITFTGANGTAPYTFTYNINGGANQTVSSGASTTVTVSVPTTVAGTFTYNLVSVASANSCSQAQTGSAVVTVNPLPTATISGTTTVCQNDPSPTITFTGANGTAPYTFTYNINGGANQTVSSGAGSTASVSVSTATAGTFTYNLVSVSGANGCSQAQTGNAVVTVSLLPTATISGTTTVCQNSASPSVTFTGSNGVAPYTFTYNINGGANQTISSGSGSTATISVPTTTAGTFTYNLVSVSIGTCSNLQSGSAVVTVNPQPTATISGTVSVCQNTGNQTVTFTGANGTAPYTFTYSLNGGANQTISSGAGNTATISVSSAVAGTFTYTLISVSEALGCSQTQTGTATVTIDPAPTATISGTTSVCQNAVSPTITFTGANGTAPYTFTYSLNGGANQTIVSNASGVATIAVSAATPGTFSYTLIDVTSAIGCSQTQTGTATVTVLANPNATISGSANVCQNDPAPVVTFTGSNDAPSYLFTYTINGGANQTVSSGAAGSTATLNAPTTTAGTFVYDLIAVQGNNSCSQTLNQTVTIVVNPTPTATISGATTICEGSGATLTVTGTPNSTVTYSDGTATSTVVLSATGSGTISTGALTSTTTYTLQSVQSAAPASCVATLTSSVTVTVNPIPVADAVSDIAVCAGQTVNVPAFVSTPAGATFGWANSTPSIGLAVTGTGNISSFTGVNTGTSASVGTVTYAPTLNGCNGLPQTFTITIYPLPVASAGADGSACQNSGNVPIGGPGDPNNSYSWTPATGLSSAVSSNPNVSSTTVGTTNYTLTVTSSQGCVNTDNVTVTINGIPQVSIAPSTLQDCAPVSVTFTANAPTSVNCIWTIDGVGTLTGCGPVTAEFDIPGQYGASIVVTDANGCTNTAVTASQVLVFPEVIASFGVDALSHSTIDPTFHFSNASVNATNYQWTFGDGTSSTVFAPTHTYGGDDEAVYNVMLVASNNYCIDTAVLTISTTPDLIFYVPNTFTPDGDENNNVFFPVFSSGFDRQSYTLLIFDRWGEIIFESHDIDVGWDGTYHDMMCKEGVYTWKILIKEKTVDKHHEYHGHVTLLK